MSKSDRVKQDNEDYERMVKQSYNHKNRASHSERLNAPTQTGKSLMGCGGLIVIVLIIICGVFLFHSCSLGGGSGYSAPSNPTTPKQEAEYARAEIVKNIHKNEPNIKVSKATVNRAGELNIYTNIHTLRQSKIKSIWGEIYDDRANGNDCDNTRLYGAHGFLLFQGDSQDSGNLNYGTDTIGNDE